VGGYCHVHFMEACNIIDKIVIICKAHLGRSFWGIIPALCNETLAAIIALESAKMTV